MQITPSLSSPKLIIPFIHFLPSATSLIPPKIQAKCQGDSDKTIYSFIFKLFISTLISLLSCLFFQSRKHHEGSETFKHRTSPTFSNKKTRRGLWELLKREGVFKVFLQCSCLNMQYIMPCLMSCRKNQRVWQFWWALKEIVSAFGSCFVHWCSNMLHHLIKIH